MSTIEETKSKIIMEIIQSNHKMRKRYKILNKIHNKYFGTDVDVVKGGGKIPEYIRRKLHAEGASK